MYCPKCKADHAHRSHRKDLRERLASLLAFYPYRCDACHHRFLRFRYELPEVVATDETSAVRMLKAARASKQLKRKRREFLLFGGALLLFILFLYYMTRERAPASDGS
jgi:type II secretory ATPase GspE/PulE/Tfp pilus assembly ATPase PilB-like protein